MWKKSFILCPWAIKHFVNKFEWFSFSVIVTFYTRYNTVSFQLSHFPSFSFHSFNIILSLIQFQFLWRRKLFHAGCDSRCQFCRRIFSCAKKRNDYISLPSSYYSDIIISCNWAFFLWFSLRFIDILLIMLKVIGGMRECFYETTIDVKRISSLCIHFNFSIKEISTSALLSSSFHRIQLIISQ